jgi:transglutaminase-like putative cysteine protease
MLYSITHTTHYQYHEIVDLCHNIAILSPRNTASQTCQSFNIAISPLPEIIEEYEDFFGNKVCYFVVEQEHEALSVTATSVVEKKNSIDQPAVTSTQSWESVRDLLQKSTGDFMYERQFCTATNITSSSVAIKEFAAISFILNRPLFEAVYDLMQRIYAEFDFTPGFTTISTPLSTVMEERKGVCQDFAHLAIASVHAMGLPARYVSGYLETLAAAGKEKLTGVDASHAWFSVFIPEMGWVDFDPTNNQLPTEQYITIGWGRDYFDIIPLKGVIMSGGTHELKVSVDVKRL